jgi:hypothetical protein
MQIVKFTLGVAAAISLFVSIADFKFMVLSLGYLYSAFV